MTDMASPWHSAPDGTPLCWGCSLRAEAAHVLGEDVSTYTLMGLLLFNHTFATQIAQAVLNARAAFAIAFPDQYQMAVSGWIPTVQNKAYAGLVMQTGSINPDPVLLNEVTDCLLGNPAACPDEGDSFFQSIITSGGYPSQICLGGVCRPTK